MASATTSNLDKMLTTLFPDRAADHGYEQSRLLSLVRKNTQFYGDDKKTIINIAPTAGGSVGFSTAQGNKQPTQQVRFTVEHKLEYQLFSIAGPLLRRAKGRGAIVDIYKHEMKNALYAFWRSIATGMWGNGGGSRGVIGSVTGNDTIVLSTKADISRFEKGMYVQLSDDNGTASSPAGLRRGPPPGPGAATMRFATPALAAQRCRLVVRRRVDPAHPSVPAEPRADCTTCPGSSRVAGCGEAPAIRDPRNPDRPRTSDKETTRELRRSRRPSTA